MKKVVSFIIALFVFIGVTNAQKVVFDATTFSNFTEKKGAPHASFEKDGISLSFDVAGFENNISNKGVRWMNNCLTLNGNQKTTGKMTVTCNMSSDLTNEGVYIKKIRFNVAGFTTSGVAKVGTAGFGNVGLASDATGEEGKLFVDVQDYSFEVEDGFSCISEMTITADLSYNLKIQNVEVVYGYFEDNITLSDTEVYPYMGKNVYVKNVTYSRAMNGKNWGTLCLPFAYTPKGQNFSVYRIEEGSFNKTSDPITLMLVNPNEEVPAGHPVIFYCKSQNLVVSAKDVLLTSDNFDSNGIYVYDGETRSHVDFDFCGALKETVISDGYYIKNNTFTYLTGSGTCRIKPYRAYIVPNATSSSARPRSLAFRVIDDESELFSNDATAVETVDFDDAEPEVLAIFTADGKQISELQKGLNIVKTTNGTKKIYVR